MQTLESFSGPAREGYIMARDIVTVGVRGDGSGRWCACFVRFTGLVCLRKALARAYDFIGCCTGATASSALVSEAAKPRDRKGCRCFCKYSTFHAVKASLVTYLISERKKSGHGRYQMEFPCRVSRVAARRRRCYGSSNTQPHWQTTSASSAHLRIERTADCQSQENLIRV
jgi:hypothetical protein